MARFKRQHLKTLLGKRIEITGSLEERDGHYILFRVKKDRKRLTNHIVLEETGRVNDKKYSSLLGEVVWCTGLVNSYTDSMGNRKYGIDKIRDMQSKKSKEAINIEHHDRINRHKRVKKW